MAHWIPDPLSGLPRRPFKSTAEIDDECEAILRRYLALPPAVAIPLPLSTDLLTGLIEAEAERLDLFADLGRDVEGCTDISAHQRPWVRINRRLSLVPQLTHRLRYTLAHEYYHLRFHAPFYQDHLTNGGLLSLAPAWPGPAPAPSHPGLAWGRVDWREWQAAYGAGALLMPRTALQTLLQSLDARAGRPPYREKTREAAAVVALVATGCEVSRLAALIRLKQQGWVVAASSRAACPRESGGGGWSRTRR